MGQGGGAGGVAAPGSVQFCSVGGPSSMGPSSSSVRSTMDVFWLVMLGGEGVNPRRSGQGNPRRALRLYWPASRYASGYG